MAACRVATFEDEHLSGVLRLCEAEGWPSLPSDPTRAQAMLVDPNAVTVVALIDTAVVGFAFAFVDAGRIDGYLATLAVEKAHRRNGIARALVSEIFERSGISRLDLLAEPGSEAFYEALTNRPFRGYRLYPSSRATTS
jgi:ribosomal protein S18 acetylase RimI-like enzyme